MSGEPNEAVMQRLHDESGHRGRDGTYQKAKLRYSWDELYKDIDCYASNFRNAGRTVSTSRYTLRSRRPYLRGRNPSGCILGVADLL